MSGQVFLWGMVGLIGALIAMLALVGIRRRMERQDGEPSNGNTGAGRRFGRKFGYGVGIADVAEAVTGQQVSRKARIGLAIAGSAVAIAVGAAVSAAKQSERAMEIVETEIEAGPLKGTLLMPSKSHAPVVLIVPGSGPTDRDGNSPAGVRGNSYRLLAEALAGKGIGSVRVDKFGMFASKAAGDANSASLESYAADYRAWIAAIRARTGAKCVWLLGHSEGAMMVSAAAQGQRDVCGLILASGVGRNLADVMREQLKSNPANAPILDSALHAIDELQAGRHVDVSGLHPALQRLFAPQVQDFEISMFQVDPVKLVRDANVRTLVLQGSTDIQVSIEDAKRLNTAPKTKLVILDGVNHLLKEAPADRAANIATYANPDLPLAPGVAKAIAAFIKNDD